MTPADLRESARRLREQAAYADSRSAYLEDIEKANDLDRRAAALEQPDTEPRPDHLTGLAQFSAERHASRAAERAGQAARIRIAIRQMEALLGLPHKD